MKTKLSFYGHSLLGTSRPKKTLGQTLVDLGEQTAAKIQPLKTNTNTKNPYAQKGLASGSKGLKTMASLSGVKHAAAKTKLSYDGSKSVYDSDGNLTGEVKLDHGEVIRISPPPPKKFKKPVVTAASAAATAAKQNPYAGKSLASGRKGLSTMTALSGIKHASVDVTKPLPKVRFAGVPGTKPNRNSVIASVKDTLLNPYRGKAMASGTKGLSTMSSLSGVKHASANMNALEKYAAKQLLIEKLSGARRLLRLSKAVRKGKQGKTLDAWARAADKQDRRMKSFGKSRYAKRSGAGKEPGIDLDDLAGTDAKAMNWIKQMAKGGGKS